VHIVTARDPAKEALFPHDTVRVHLDRLSLSHYFTDDRVHYTSDTPKLPTLKKLGSTLHYDDNMQEHIDNFGGIPVKNPYDYYPDVGTAAKAIIYDIKDNILLLRRTDEGQKWDIPGGHIKTIEANRGEEGFEEGLEREVAEETGLILPFSKKIATQKFTWKGKTNEIVFYMSKFDKLKPECNLKLQGFMENDEFKWVSIDEIYKYAKNGTQVLRKAVELAKEHGILTEEERFQVAMKRKHRKMKQKLIGMGKNKRFGGGKGHSRPSMERSKSAPPGFGAIGEEKGKKKRKIRVKIVSKST
jgi:ADP-ribose pyrophosphatase YjhB (NUDIX family)